MSAPRFAQRAALLLGAILFLTSTATAQQGYPGSSWGELSYDWNSYVGGGLIGYVNQGIDWTQLPGDVTLNTFVELRYRYRSKNNDFYNSYGPKVGVEFQKWIFKAGVAYYWERFPKLAAPDDSSNKLQYYLHWYDDWDLKRHVQKLSTLHVVGFSGSTWGELSHDNDSLVGSGFMGYVNQGVDWVDFGGGLTLTTYAEFRYRGRSKNNEGYNAYGPKLGVELKKSGFSLGADYYWERFPKLAAPDDRDNKFQVYLRWYVDWDLKRSRR